MIAAVFFRALLAGFMVLLLPPLAKAEFKATPEEAQMCAAILSPLAVKGDPNWSHTHHYCDCLRFTNRAYRSIGKSKTDFAYNLGVAMDGCDYVIRHTTPDFSLLPDIHLQKGIIYSLQGQDAISAAEYLKALNGNQKLVRAYIGMAEFFIKTNDKKKALEIITKGLQNNPESKALKRMYKELGGTLPYPAPAAPVEQPVGSGTANVPAPIAEPSLAPGKVEKQEAKGAAAHTPVEEKREIGSPTNPWCRFCTDTPPAPPAPSPTTPGVIPKAWQ